MSRIDKYLNEISKAVYEPLRDDIMECTICGRKADVLNEGKGPLICCGKPMIKVGEAVDRFERGEISMAETAWVKHTKTVEIPVDDEEAKDEIEEAEGMEGLPKGWNQNSLKRFAKSLTGKEGTQKGFFDKCVKKMQGKIDNPEGFCASAKDELHGSTMWRGKGKTPQQAGKDVKAKQNVKQG